MQANWQRQLAVLANLPADVKLVLLPELCLQGRAPGLPPQDQRRNAIRVPGPELQSLLDFARSRQVHVAASVWEDDPAWPELFFQTGLVISPSGEVVLKKRKLQGCQQAASPFDVYTKYAETGDFFPVVDTPVGKLALSLNEEILVPENARCLALRGVEVICHLTAEACDERMDMLHEVKLAASAMNGCFLACADTAVAGRSCITDWMGRTLAEAAGPGELIVSAVIDVERIRFERTKGASIAMLNATLWARELRRYGGIPLDSGARNEAERAVVEQEQLRQLVGRGLLTKSALPYEER